ncbi:MAG: DEAD/DEAH box helicase [Chloroflexota bacterium]
MNGIIFIHGVNNKPVASKDLENILSKIREYSGECFFGFPLIATPEGKYAIDATWVSPQKGIVLFDLVEGTNVNVQGLSERQDNLANKVDSKLRLYKELVKGRRLLPALHVVTFAPALSDYEIKQYLQDGYPLANSNGLIEVLSNLKWEDASEYIYRLSLSAIENLSNIRRAVVKRDTIKPNSRGSKLKKIEDSIATLDHRQNRAVIETVNGVQRIRGLAGSGKTIVLALKAAYLHTQYPEWRIAVTFHTRALKGQFKQLINNFCIQQSGEEPDWSRIRVINAWGAPGDEEKDGLYHEFCKATGIEFLDFKSASLRFGGNDHAFNGVCQYALNEVPNPQPLYDAILVDEAQDFTPSFLRLCYAILKKPKRLVYAYDELQNLSGVSLPPPEEIFGTDESGRPLVSLVPNSPQDVILYKCYRNSRPVLVTAHALGFGIYREPTEGNGSGLVQMFDEPALWDAIGYRVYEGELAKGKRVILERTEDTSPKFLEDHSEIDDIIQFKSFKNEQEQNQWLINQIKTNLKEDELRHDDIMVIHPDPKTAILKVGPIRAKLFDMQIQTHLAGVDTQKDVFFKTDTPSVTFTGIYRAKGNEAGMVYVINAQECDGSQGGLASLRNRLFTAITRSKAWVRVLGYGSRMENLIKEFDKLKNNSFRLDFVYPTDDMLEKIRIVHRDLSLQERKRLESKLSEVEQIVKALENGEISPEDIPPETRRKLLGLLGGS